MENENENPRQWFYNSVKWKRTRKAYLSSKCYLCERCGGVAKIVHHKKYVTPSNMYDPNITLNWNNLEALCFDCHNAEHFGTGATAQGLTFDSQGNLIKK